MIFKDIAVKKYVVRLNAEERAYLDELIRKGNPSRHAWESSYGNVPNVVLLEGKSAKWISCAK